MNSKINSTNEFNNKINNEFKHEFTNEFKHEFNKIIQKLIQTMNSQTNSKMNSKPCVLASVHHSLALERQRNLDLLDVPRQSLQTIPHTAHDLEGTVGPSTSAVDVEKMPSTSDGMKGTAS